MKKVELIVSLPFYTLTNRGYNENNFKPVERRLRPKRLVLSAGHSAADFSRSTADPKTRPGLAMTLRLYVINSNNEARERRGVYR